MLEGYFCVGRMHCFINSGIRSKGPTTENLSSIYRTSTQQLGLVGEAMDQERNFFNETAQLTGVYWRKGLRSYFSASETVKQNNAGSHSLTLGWKPVMCCTRTILGMQPIHILGGSTLQAGPE